MTKLCKHCKQVKPLSEYYQHPNAKDGLQPYCKDCAKAISRKSLKRNQPREYEVRFVEYLKSKGIYAVVGRSSRTKAHRFVDVVAWGCVGIELKTCNVHDNGEIFFSFSIAQTEKMLAQIVAFEIITDGISEYYLIPADHPVLFKNGKRRKAIVIKEQSGQKPSPRANLIKAVFMQGHNNIELIEQCRIKVSRSLETGHPVGRLYLPEQMRIKQMSMFE